MENKLCFVKVFLKKRTNKNRNNHHIFKINVPLQKYNFYKTMLSTYPLRGMTSEEKKYF